MGVSPPAGYIATPYPLSGSVSCTSNDLAGYAGKVTTALHGNNPPDLPNPDYFWVVDCSKPAYFVASITGTPIYYVFNIIQTRTSGGMNVGWAAYFLIPTNPTVVATYDIGSQ